MAKIAFAPENSEYLATTAMVRQFLYSAALQEFDLIRYFVESARLHPDTTLDNKPTAMCYAALKHDLCLVQYLIIHGGNPNRGDGLGMTPMHYAALGGCARCIGYLVKSNGDVNRRNKCGKTPLELVQDCSHLAECADLLGRYVATSKGISKTTAGFH